MVKHLGLRYGALHQTKVLGGRESLETVERVKNMLKSGMSRRTFIVSAAAFAAVGALGANLALADEKKEEAADAASGDVEFDGPFIVGFDQDFPPYGYVGDDGEYTGFDLDLAAAVCDKEGWEIQLEPIAWDAKDALLNSGQITCIWNGFTIEGREDDYAFTDPYMENRQVVVVKADSGIEKLADLAGKNVVTQADSAALGLLSEGGDQAELGASFAKLETLPDYNTAFMSLQMGEYDAVALDYPVAVFQIGDKADEFTILDEALNSEHYAVGFAKGNEALAAKVEEDLKALADDGTVEELCEKYADQGVDFAAWCLGKEDAAGADSDKAEGSDAAGSYKDGTYEGEGKGIGGKVPVTVTVEGGKVAKVEVGDNSETQGIGSKAIEQLPDEIVAANGTEGVDAVSGASVTSKAIFTAVDAALEQAK